MPRVPETRASLILRLPTADDADAWQQFVSIYEPFVYRFARRGGLQDADARELVQNVLIAVARAVGRWKPDHEQGRFRTWLFRIARNQLIDVLNRRQRQNTATGVSGFSDLLDHKRVAEMTSESELRKAHRQELFRWAAERVRTVVKPASWKAFWMTAVDNCDPEVVAAELNLSVGAVYIARSRVLARLRDEVGKWEDDHAV